MIIEFIKLFAHFLILTLILSCNNDSMSGKNYRDLNDDDYVHASDTVDGKTIYFKTATSAYSPQDFINVDNKQKLFIRRSLEEADLLIREYYPHSSIDNFSPQTLDSLIDKWNIDKSSFSCTENYFVEVIGIAFGHFLVKSYKMKWSIVTDEYGTDYATILEELKLSNFPLNSVAKAIEQKRSGSLQTISLMTKRQIKELSGNNK